MRLHVCNCLVKLASMMQSRRQLLAGDGCDAMVSGHRRWWVAGAILVGHLRTVSLTTTYSLLLHRASLKTQWKKLVGGERKSSKRRRVSAKVKTRLRPIYYSVIHMQRDPPAKNYPLIQSTELYITARHFRPRRERPATVQRYL